MIEVTGNPICEGCGVQLLNARNFGSRPEIGWLWADEVTGSVWCAGEPGTWDQSHRPDTSQIPRDAMDSTP